METDRNSLYTTLKRRIIEFHYKPGQILNEQELAEEFSVSRSPVRTALQELERDRLLNIVPRYGAQVSAIDFRNIKGLFEVTKLLDPYATRLAVKNITEEQVAELKVIVKKLESFSSTSDYQDAINEDQKFHDIIFKASDNKWLEKLLGSSMSIRKDCGTTAMNILTTCHCLPAPLNLSSMPLNKAMRMQPRITPGSISTTLFPGSRKRFFRLEGC